MGEAKRRRAEATAVLQAGMERAHAEGQGVWELAMYHRSMLPEILIGAAMGDRTGRELAEAVKSIVEGIVHPTLGKDKPAFRASCGGRSAVPRSRPVAPASDAYGVGLGW